MTISVLIPCYNEELSIARSLQAWLEQTRLPDEIVVVDDKSTDRSAEIIKTFLPKVKLITLEQKGGNKSVVQEQGLKYITGDIFISTDADTLVDKNFVSQVEKAFKHKGTIAFAGQVKSLPKNWLTACREMEYALGQIIHKTAQNLLGFIYVIPGCAGAFRTDYFCQKIKFDHDTLTEDLDFTYKLNNANKKIYYDPKAIVYTQDPATLKSYINQMRRWYAGGWQCLTKHKNILKKPIAMFEIFLMYFDAPFFFLTLYVLPFVNFGLYLTQLKIYLLMCVLFGALASVLSKRWDLLLYSPTYIIVAYINSYIFAEQFIKEIVLRKKQLTWFHPERWQIGNPNI